MNCGIECSTHKIYKDLAQSFCDALKSIKLETTKPQDMVAWDYVYLTAKDILEQAKKLGVK